MHTNKNKNNGRFVKGISGNPAGRPPGSRNQAGLLMEALLEGEAHDLTRKLIEMAKEGNAVALRLCIDRLLPRQRDRTVHFPMPSIKTLDDIAQATMSIITAVSEGNLTPQEGEAMSRIVNDLANIMINQDLQQRVEKLEQGFSQSDGTVPLIKQYR